MNKTSLIFLILFGGLLLSVITFHIADSSGQWRTITEGVKNGESFDTIFGKWEKERHPERYVTPAPPSLTPSDTLAL